VAWVDAVRWAGVLLAIAGVWVTSRDAVKRYRNELVHRCQRGWEWVRRQVLRRRDRTIRAHAISGSVGVSGNLNVRVNAAGWVWPNDRDERLEQLRQRTETLNNRISDLRSEHGQRLDTLAADIARVGTEYREALDKLIHDLAQRAEQATTIDAAGLPLIGAGIVLSGVPDNVLRHWWACLLLLVAAALVSVTAYWIHHPLSASG
jgi:cell division protein FtsB